MIVEATPPSVHQMIVELESKRLISREPGVPRSIKLLLVPQGGAEVFIRVADGRRDGDGLRDGWRPCLVNAREQLARKPDLTDRAKQALPLARCINIDDLEAVLLEDIANVRNSVVKTEGECVGDETRRSGLRSFRKKLAPRQEQLTDFSEVLVKTLASGNHGLNDPGGIATPCPPSTAAGEPPRPRVVPRPARPACAGARRGAARRPGLRARACGSAPAVRGRVLRSRPPA